MDNKQAMRLERHFKGAANHYRLQILMYVAGCDRATVDVITEALSANFKTISQHTISLVKAGLLNKTTDGKFVQHSLSPFGKKFVTFIKSFPN